MTKLQNALNEIVYKMSWNQDWFLEEIGEDEMQQLAKLAKIMQNKYEHSSKQKSSLLDKFQASNYEYIKKIDKERYSSKHITKTKNGQPILYATFDQDYKINPTDASKYVDQYKTL